MVHPDVILLAGICPLFSIGLLLYGCVYSNILLIIFFVLVYVHQLLRSSAPALWLPQLNIHVGVETLVNGPIDLQGGFGKLKTLSTGAALLTVNLFAWIIRLSLGIMWRRTLTIFSWSISFTFISWKGHGLPASRKPISWWFNVLDERPFNSKSETKALFLVSNRSASYPQLYDIQQYMR